MQKADIGLIGLAVMGENLVLNMESHGFTVAVYNRTTSRVDEFVDGKATGDTGFVEFGTGWQRTGTYVDKLNSTDLLRYNAYTGIRNAGIVEVRAVLRHVPALDRLRLSSIDSIEADDDLMRAIAEEERLMPHLHLSLQSGDDMILKRMKRRHLRDDAIRFCAEMRAARPDLVYGADIIAGFPTGGEPCRRLGCESLSCPRGIAGLRLSGDDGGPGAGTAVCGQCL